MFIYVKDTQGQTNTQIHKNTQIQIGPQRHINAHKHIWTHMDPQIHTNTPRHKCKENEVQRHIVHVRNDVNGLNNWTNN